MKARAALAIALFGIVLAPLVAPVYGPAASVGLAAVTSTIGIALFPEPRA